MKRPFLSYCIALLVPIMAWGCASIIEGKTQAVTFNSDPPGAQVIINGMPMCVTPSTITLKKDEYDNANVIFKKEGYQDQQANLHTKVTGWFWGNIISGGLLGSATDAISGAMWEYSPDKYFMTLPPLKASAGELARLDYENKVRMFLLFNHEQLVADLARGEGESLSSLYVLLGLNKVNQEATILGLRRLMVFVKDTPEFAEAVLREFRMTTGHNI